MTLGAGFVGSSPEQLEWLGQQFLASADKLDGLRSELSGRLNHVQWDGPDAERVRSDWDASHAGALHLAAEMLRTADQRLRTNAQQQRQASSGDGAGFAAVGSLAAAGALAGIGGATASDGQSGRSLLDGLIQQGVLPPEFASMTVDQAHEYLRQHPELAARLATNGTWHPPPGGRDAVRASFDQMSVDDRRWTALLSPASVGNTSGVPFEERFLANDVRIESARYAEHQLLADHAQFVRDNESPASGSRQGQVQVGPDPAQLQESRDRIAYYDKVLAEHRQIILFDPAGDGAVAELRGSIGANTRDVGILVPGTTAKLSNFSMGDMAQGFVNTDRTGGLAVIGWMGGDLPNSVAFDAPDPKYSIDLGPKLAEFSHDLRQEINHSVADGQSVEITAVGHSYGGAVVGVAEAHGLDANRVVHVESAGMGNGVYQPSDLHNVNSDVQRYSMTAPGDPIGYTQGGVTIPVPIPGPGGGFFVPVTVDPHGADPNTFPSVVRLATGYDAQGNVLEGTSAHTNVLNYHSDPWWQVYHVMTGGPVLPEGQLPEYQPQPPIL